MWLLQLFVDAATWVFILLTAFDNAVPANTWICYTTNCYYVVWSSAIKGQQFQLLPSVLTLHYPYDKSYVPYRAKTASESWSTVATTKLCTSCKLFRRNIMSPSSGWHCLVDDHRFRCSSLRCSEHGCRTISVIRCLSSLRNEFDSSSVHVRFAVQDRDRFFSEYFGFILSGSFHKRTILTCTHINSRLTRNDVVK